MSRLIGPMVHYRAMRQWAIGHSRKGQNRVETHTIAPSELIKDTIEWVQWRGYRASWIGGADDRGQRLPAAVVFSRKNEPLTMAVIGEVLVWDGTRITIKE